MRVSLVLYIMYCRWPHDKELYVDILIMNVFADSLTGPTDVCRVGII